MLLDKKTLFFGSCFLGVITLFFSYHLRQLLYDWSPSLWLVFVIVGCLIVIIPFMVFHWQHWDFVIWDWQQGTPSLSYHLNHNLVCLKYIGFGPFLGATIAPFLRASRPTIRHNLEFTLLTLLIPILAYCTLAYLRGLLNVHKR